MSSPANHFHDFGPFRIDRAERVLIRDGQPLTLTPKAFDLLLALVERRGHVVEKEELMGAVWPETVVEESNLTHHISVLRKVLGESAGERPYIETIPRRGYRFLAEVERVETEVATAAEKEFGVLPLGGMTRERGLPPEGGIPNKGRLITFVTIAILVLAATVAWFYFRRPPILIGKDTILLADFENKTGDEIFDGTLRQGLAIQLQQSPFLNLFPEPQVRQTLRLMGRAPNELVTVEVAREICERQSIKSLVAGSIVSLGSHYAITLEAINGQSGESLAREQVEAESKEQVLRALSQAATRLRERLGESLSSIQRFDKPLEQATTAKLEAFKAYSLGIEHSYRGRPMEAIPFYRRAVEIDPEFAHAYSVLSVVHWSTGRPGLAAEYAEKGYALRERVSEYEKLRITSFYHGFATGDLNRRIEVVMLQRRMYPREWSGPTDLGLTYSLIGQYDQESRKPARPSASIPILPPRTGP